MSRYSAILQTIIGLSALTIGVLVYVADRDADQVYFLPAAYSFANESSAIFGQIGGYLPDFLHVYAFILLSCAALRPDRMGVIKISALWFLLDLFFEAGQHPAIASQLANNVPGWFLQVPILENTSAYFRRGAFDPIDMVAITLGSIAAYLTVILMPPYHSLDHLPKNVV